MVLSRCKTIAPAAVADEHAGDAHKFFILHSRLLESTKNPGATLGFAVFASSGQPYPWA